ncbi:MAG: hypothetical protein J7647_22460 [Cyanobacteria bacterium SBLK]|nr:hypothetical protein [Cyanobacteria bacterium SBLK]
MPHKKTGLACKKSVDVLPHLKAGGFIIQQVIVSEQGFPNQEGISPDA